MGSLTQFRWTSASCSDVGLVRDINEDSCLDQPHRGLWVVADGMGGHNLGDFASQLVVDTLSQLEVPNSVGKFVSAVREQLQAVNGQLRDAAAARDVPIIGSTVVVLVACDSHCGYLWAGDSRLYLFRNGRLKQLTRDHNHVEELRSRGELPPEDSIDFPSRNMITRAVGATDTLDLDEQTIKVEDEDVLLLCSDGLTNEVSDREICAALVSGNCRQAAETLVEIALDHGGRDNVSVVVARAEDLYSTDKTILNPAFL